MSSLRVRRRELERAWARWVPGQGTSATDQLRAEVVESWRRSLAAVDRATGTAPAADADWAASDLRAPVSAVADELRRIADDAGYVAAVTDERGTILWTCGGRLMRRQAERMNFAPGGRWDEEAMGTNALSLALRSGQAATVFSAEHYVAALHGWVCYCAPIRGRDGRTLGVLDLSTTWDRANPLALSTVKLLASGIEARLPAVAPSLRLQCLGPGAHAAEGGARLPLKPRQLEILALLVLEPGGWSAERLRDALYGERPVSASTFKAEVSHLRRVLGGRVAARTYALTGPVGCDAADVLAALERRDTAAAVAAYRGPLLPQSEAPAVAEWREHLEVAVREAVLASSDAGTALRYGQVAPYDTEVHRHALRLLGPQDPRRGIAAARLQQS